MRNKFGVVSSVGHVKQRIIPPESSPGPRPPYHAEMSTASDRRSWAVPFASTNAGNVITTANAAKGASAARAYGSHRADTLRMFVINSRYMLMASDRPNLVPGPSRLRIDSSESD